MTWGVWCARSGGVMPAREAWLREDGEVWTADTEAAATTKARETSLGAHETFVTAGRENPLSYRARELTARRRVFHDLKNRSETDG